MAFACSLHEQTECDFWIEKVDLVRRMFKSGSANTQLIALCKKYRANAVAACAQYDAARERLKKEIIAVTGSERDAEIVDKQCPPRSVPQCVDPENICGADVTDMLTNAMYWDSVFNGPLIEGIMWRPGGGRDYKRKFGQRLGGGLCAKGKDQCKKSLTLCERCVKADAPGNMGLGSVAGLGAAAHIGGFDRIMGAGEETDSDRAAYRLGAIVSEKVFAAMYSGKPNIWDNIQDVICEVVERAYGVREEFPEESIFVEGCDPCEVPMM